MGTITECVACKTEERRRQQNPTDKGRRGVSLRRHELECRACLRLGQRLRKLPRCWRPVGGKLLQCSEDCVVEIPGNRVANRCKRSWLFSNDTRNDGLRCWAGEWRIAGEHLVHNRAERID